MTTSEVAVTGQDFATAIHFEVGTDIQNSWNAQLQFPSIAGIEENDVLLVAFWARTISSVQETGEGSINVIVEDNVSYEKQISYSLTIGNTWKQYYASATSAVTLGSSEVTYAFHIGFSQQIIEVADIQFLNYKQTLTEDDLPFTEITYFGQDPDAPWRAEAAARIEQHRKGPMKLTVYDETGTLLPAADVTVEMVQHDFGFGTAIPAKEFNDNETFRNKVLEMFNEVVFENDLKWRQFNPGNTAHISRAMDTLDKHHIPVRGHNIIWPSWKFTPSYLEDFANDPEKLRNEIDKRIDDVTQYTSGRLNDWDVINEPYTNHDIMDILGDEVMADWFKRARQNDRDVKLYLNDYSIISGGGKNTAKQDYYYNLVQQIETWGGDIGGIGIQGHMSTELTPITKVYEILDRFAELGKEIKITEFDIDMDQRAVQADYTRDFLTINFSHPAVKSVLVWGFWESRHWKPEAAFFNADWSIRPHGEMWNELIYNQWWTPDTVLTSDAQGEASLAGFLGKYKYTITHNGSTRTGFFEHLASTASEDTTEAIISLDETFPESAMIESSVKGFLCDGERTLLSVPYGENIQYSWFLDGSQIRTDTSTIETGQAGSYTVQLTKGNMQILTDPYEVTVRPAAVATILPSNDTTLCDNETLTLTGNTMEGLTYSWYKDDVQVEGVSGELIVDGTGSYRLKTALNGCTAVSETVNVEVGTTPEAAITISGDHPVCEGEGVYLLGPFTTGVSYTWFYEGEEMEYGGRVREVFEGGTYTLETALGDCKAVSEPVEVVVNPYPESVITYPVATGQGDLTFCEGESIVLTAIGIEGAVYNWLKDGTMTDSARQSFTVTEGGEYELITTLEDCSTTSWPVIVTELPASDPGCANSIEAFNTEERVYPNPFSGSFMVRTNASALSATTLSLFDATGRQILLLEGDAIRSETKITVPKPGIYLLQVREGQELSTIKLIGE